MILTTGMAHPRKLIRHAVAALLLGKTAAGDRVTRTRVEPNKKHELPAISVYTPNEPVTEGGTSAPRELTRELKVEITAWAAHTAASPADDALDDLAEQIEAAMDAERYIDNLVADSVLEDTEFTMLNEGGADPLTGAITLTYSVTYRTQPADGESAEFLHAGVTTQVAGADDDNVASDLINVRGTP